MNDESQFLAAKRGLRLDSADDALVAISSGLAGCIFTVEDLSPTFFELQTGLAGEIFQKFANYGFKVAFVLPPEHPFGERVTELAREHASHPCIRFTPTVQAAHQWLAELDG